MATYEKIKFSNGANLSGINWVDDGVMPSPYTLHATTSSSDVIDEIWLWISSTYGYPFTFEVVGNASGQTDIQYWVGSVPENTYGQLILPGIIMSGWGGGSTYLNIGNFVTPLLNFDSVAVYGYVNRITP